MPSFSDSIFLFILLLLLFGPKSLPKLAREVGKWVGEFRRASNEFKMQMEDELRLSEQEERLKKIEAMEAAAPKTAELPGETTENALAADSTSTPQAEIVDPLDTVTPAPLAIAEAGELKIMPPSTGLPTPRTSARESEGHALGGLLDSIPAAEKNGNHASTEPAETAHGH